MIKPHYIWSYFQGRYLKHEAEDILFYMRRGLKVSARARLVLLKRDQQAGHLIPSEGVDNGHFYGPSRISQTIDLQRGHNMRLSKLADMMCQTPKMKAMKSLYEENLKKSRSTSS